MACQFGVLEMIGLESGGRQYWLDFRQYRPAVGIAASWDGKQLYVLGGPFEGLADIMPARNLGRVIAVAYRARREDKTEHYGHEFRPVSRPQLIFTSGHLLRFAGGAYEFKDTGINDR